MKYVRCTCGWVYIVGRKHVYGPIYLSSPDSGKVMTRKEWEALYGDCAAFYETRQEPFLAPYPHKKG